MATRSLITEYVKGTDGNYKSVEIHPITDSASVLTTTTQTKGSNYTNYTGLPLEVGEGKDTTAQETVLQSLLKTRNRLYELRAFNNVTINTSGYTNDKTNNSVPSSKVLYDAITNVNTNVTTTVSQLDSRINTNSANIYKYSSDINGLKNDISRVLCTHPMYQFLHPNNRLTHICYYDPVHFDSTSNYENFISIPSNKISELENNPQGYGVYHLSNKQGFYKFKITIFAYTKPASDLIYREIKNGRTTNDLMLVEDENESLYVKDIIIGHFGCRKGGEKGAGQGKGNEYFRFHVTNIMSGRSKDEVITDNCVGTEYRNNKPLGQAYMYSQLYNFAFLWTTGEKGSIDLQLGSYDMYGVDKGKSIIVIEAFYYPEVTENW